MIIKVWDFLSQNITSKLVILHCDIRAGLVRHSQAQKCLQINYKPFHKVDIKFENISLSKIFYLLTDQPTDRPID